MEKEVLVAMVTGDVNPVGCVLARGGTCPRSTAAPRPWERRVGLWELKAWVLPEAVSVCWLLACQPLPRG